MTAPGVTCSPRIVKRQQFSVSNQLTVTVPFQCDLGSPLLPSPSAFHSCCRRKTKPLFRRAQSVDVPSSPDLHTFDWFGAPKDDAVLTGHCGLLLPIPVRGTETHPDSKTAAAVQAAKDEPDSEGESDEESDSECSPPPRVVRRIADNDQGPVFRRGGSIVKLPSKSRKERRRRAARKFGQEKSRTLCVSWGSDALPMVSTFEYVVEEEYEDFDEMSSPLIPCSPQNNKKAKTPKGSQVMTAGEMQKLLLTDDGCSRSSKQAGAFASSEIIFCGADDGCSTRAAKQTSGAFSSAESLLAAAFS